MSANHSAARMRGPSPRRVDAWGLNPLWIRGLRSRGRLPHVLSWGIVTFTITVFVSLMTYMTITERELATFSDAAKMVLPGIIIIQAVILMMGGTSAVASGISRERDEGLLDYQRMTPMSPTARIIGYLFGLSMREYILFAITVPMLAAAVYISGFSLATLAHFYLVFFLSVCVYHMTALVAGMVAPNARMAMIVALGLVVALYLVLPNLSQIGLSFFEYLTIRPTFFGLIEQELPEELRGSRSALRIARFHDVPFFAGALHPTLYTILVQGFLLATLFTIVHRRWRRETSHLFSKVGAVIVFAGITFFLFGSVWAIVVQDDAHDRIFNRWMEPGFERSMETLAALFLVSTLIIGSAYVILVTAMTPERSTMREGWRRARKLGRTSLGANSDAASSAPAAMVMIAVMLLAGGVLLGLIRAEGDYFVRPPAWSAVALAAAAIVGIALFVQGVRERFGMRVYAVLLFLVWMVPFFTALLLIVAFEDPVAGAYVMLPFPPATIGFTIGHLFESTMPEGVHAGARLLPQELQADGLRLATVGAIGALAMGVLAQVAARRHRARLKRLELAPSAA